MCGNENHCPIVYTYEVNETINAVMFVGTERWTGGRDYFMQYRHLRRPVFKVCIVEQVKLFKWRPPGLK